MKRRFLALLGCASVWVLSAHGALAQNTNAAANGNGTDNPDWVEDTVQSAPAFSTKNLIPIDMPIYVTTKASLDPETLVVGGDGVVRYVMVLGKTTGNVNAVYEGIRCPTSEVKTYARFGTNGQWSMVRNPVWRGMDDNLPSKHALAFARQAACVNYVSTSKAEVLATLKYAGPPGPSQYNQ